MNCVYVHGFGDGSFVWDPIREKLADRFSSTAIDLRGHCDSEWDPHGVYCTDTYSSDILFSLSKIEQSADILIGHSLGVNICLSLVKKLMKPPKALVLVDCSEDIEHDALEYILDDFKSEHRPYKSIGEYADVLLSKRPLLTPDIAVRIAEAALRQRQDNLFYLKRDPALVLPANWGADDSEVWQNLGDIQSPVLLLRGAGSAIMSKRAGETLASRFERCQYRTIGVAGHCVMLDNPDEFCAAVDGFLGEIYSI